MPTTSPTIHPLAFIAIRAAYLRSTIGAWAAMRYCQRNGVPLSLYTTARILQNAAEEGI